MAVGWGILATGGIAKSFAEDLALLPEARLAAVGSRSLDAAETFARTHGAEAAYGSWAELAADPAVDVVYVATPHSAHHEAAKLCLEAGKAVLCEKPLTLDAATSLDLVDTARARGVFFMEAMWMRTNPAIRRVLELVGDGAIGDVVHVAADFGIPGGFAPEHRMRNPKLGGGALLDLGVYPVTFAHLFLGVPDRIQAAATLLPEGVDDSIVLLLSYDSGALATAYSGFRGASRLEATITGSTGRIEIPSLFFRPDRFTLVRDGSAEEVSVPFRGNGMSHEAEEVMRCLAEGLLESPLVPHADTLAIMRTMDTARAQTGITYPSP